MKKYFPLFSILITQTAFSQNYNITLAAKLSYGTESLSNICGWVDPDDGKEYALVGAQKGLSIVDVSVPTNPVKITQIPGPSSSWREIKTNGHYAYVTTESGTVGLQIVDLSNLPATNLTVATWKPTINSETLQTIHALHIDNGRVYLYGSNIGSGGAIIADIKTDPMAPKYLGYYDTKYVHDGYVRNDTMYACHIMDGYCAIVDAKNPATPKVLTTFSTPNNFTHNSWLTKSGKTCLTTDEKSNSFLTSYDISDLNNVTEVDRMQTNPGSKSVVHNTHILQKGEVDYAVTSWYTEGINIVDAGRPGNLVEVGRYDTYNGFSSAMNGCWGVYPFLPSGTIVASDISGGLFVLTPTYVRACYVEGIVKDCKTNAALTGVTVTLKITSPTSDSYQDITDFAGKYGVGIVTPNTYQIIFSKTGYISDTQTVVLTPGMVTPLDIILCTTQISVNDIYSNVSTSFNPNPVNSGSEMIFMIEGYDLGITKPVLQIFDLLGKQVYIHQINSKRDILNLPIANGMFLYKVTDKEGGVISQGKLCAE